MGWEKNGVTSHDALSDVDQAGTGVTAGHISDGTQTIAGDKTFSGDVTVGGNLQMIGGMIGTQLSVTDATVDSLDVSSVFLLRLVTSANDIVLNSLAGGVAGQIVYVSKPSSANSLTIKFNTGTGQKIIPSNGTDLVLSSYGGAVLLNGGSLWYQIA